MSRKPWATDVPDQRPTLNEALQAYTYAGQHAMFAEAARGEIAVGMEADLVLLTGDPEKLIES